MIKVGLIKDKNEPCAWHNKILDSFNLALSSDADKRFTNVLIKTIIKLKI